MKQNQNQTQAKIYYLKPKTSKKPCQHCDGDGFLLVDVEGENYTKAYRCYCPRGNHYEGFPYYIKQDKAAKGL